MNALHPPDERDLPAGRLDDRAAALLAVIGPHPAAARRRLAPVAAAATVLALAAAGGAIALTTGTDHHHPHLVATPAISRGPTVADPYAACRRALAMVNLDYAPPSAADLIATVRTPRGGEALFATRNGLSYCDTGPDGGSGADEWRYGTQWLTGHGFPGGGGSYGASDHVHTVQTWYGRVSADVARVRLVIDPKYDVQSDIALRNGFYLARADIVGNSVPAAVELYDSDGHLLQTLDYKEDMVALMLTQQCWTDPAGNIVLGKKDADPRTCGRAQPWVAPWN